ncbi:uncharacterized protein LOC117652961 [Thrips palmi]|uniref:Uncharacterized protein LOC117652961 n=1 Tax=Thrips palmi TaxID=161013 RepID=A0A6P9A9W0_THRPL|nr:uncharacterized protein LOC117652961 [Thrips palmi]XP_034254116.1 uncharacterized protein LOC117652961 [Thrips palmi]XP_034254117.1 uncharacterized protein LOC117652961 [Thrips palmi]
MCAMQAETSASTSGPQEEEPVDESESVPGIHKLPNEILHKIFSYVTDGRTLLKVIPAVCRRWKKAVSDRAAWHGVSVAVQANRWNPSIERAILKRAPAVRSLHVSLTDPPPLPGTRRNDRFLCALRGLIVFEELSIERVPPVWLRKAYLQLVWRSRHHLKRLDMALDSTTKTNRGHSSLHVLSQVPNLEDLTLYVEDDFVYEVGKLQQCFPNLKSIHVKEDVITPKQHDLVKDLLVGSLVCAKFYPSPSARPDLLTALAMCRGLAHLSVQSGFAPVFRSLPALTSIYIYHTVESPAEINLLWRVIESLYTPTVHKVHVVVWCNFFGESAFTLGGECRKGVEAMREKGFCGKISYQISLVKTHTGARLLTYATL